MAHITNVCVFFNTTGEKENDDIHGLYLKAFCSGLDRVLEGYRNKILELETQIMKDPHLSISHLVCQLQQVNKL